ncbi:MAG: hypothetical protein R3F35_02400 [Myxococcota bacterium]
MIRIRSRWGRLLVASTLVLTLGIASATGLTPSLARAEEEQGDLDQESLKKAEWQDRYRALRNNAVRMRDNAIKLRRAYSLSQHSNYPRGGARERFKQQVIETEQKADQYEADLARFQDEARQEQIPPGWIYEVEDEPVDPGSPASFGEDEPTHEAAAPAGRNPAYYGDEGEADEWDEDEQDDRGDAFDDFNDDRDDQYRAHPDWRDR